MSLPTPERDSNNLSLTRGKGGLFMVSSSHKIIFICGREGNFLRLLINIKGKRNSRKSLFLFLYYYFVEGLYE
jgi:hypothetical protein